MLVDWILPDRMLPGIAMGLLLVVVLYLAICALYYYTQTWLLYYPSRDKWRGYAHYHRVAPATPFQPLTIISENQYALQAWWFRGQPRQPTILFLHGNAANISHFLPTADVLGQLGYSVLLLDYRGFGESEGKPSEQGLYADARAAWDYLVNELGIAPRQIVLHGRSMGGAIAAYLGQQVDAGAVLIESAYTHLPSYLSERFAICKNVPLLPFRWLTKQQFHTQQYLRHATCPVLVIHSQQDEVVPYHHGCQLFQIAPQPKQFLTLQGKHDSGFLTDQATYRQHIQQFLQVHIAPP